MFQVLKLIEYNPDELSNFGWLEKISIQESEDGSVKIRYKLDIILPSLSKLAVQEPRRVPSTKGWIKS